MVESANEGLRDKRKAQTRADLVRQARRLTAEHGLNGYTVEELCELVGVSRRTFFNYFASKEDAVLGKLPEGSDERIMLTFAFSPPAGEHLLDELGNLAIELFEMVGVVAEEAREFMAALDREPRLFATLMRGTADEEARLAEVVALREDLDKEDPAVVMAVLLIGTILRRSAFQYFQHDNDLAFAELVFTNLHATRRVLSPTTKENSDHHI